MKAKCMICSKPFWESREDVRFYLCNGHIPEIYDYIDKRKKEWERNKHE